MKDQDIQEGVPENKDVLAISSYSSLLMSDDNGFYDITLSEENDNDIFLSDLGYEAIVDTQEDNEEVDLINDDVELLDMFVEDTDQRFM